MIELIEIQQQALKGTGDRFRVLDPATHTEYVLVRSDIYARLQLLLEQAEDATEQEAWADAVEEARSEMDDITFREVIKAIGYVLDSHCEPN